MRTPVLILTALFSASLFAAGHDLTASPPITSQSRPVVTGNGAGFTAAWLEQLPYPYERYFVVTGGVDSAGQPIGGAGPRIDQQLQVPGSMAMAHSPNETVVAWNAGPNVYAERLSPSGELRNTILVSSSGVEFPTSVAVAWNGSRYFVIWCTQSQILGAFIALDGSSTQPHPFFTEPAAAKEIPVAPDIAWDGQSFVVVFGERPDQICYNNCSYNPDKFRVMRVSADGDAIDSAPAVIAGNHLRAHVAASGAESLITLDSADTVSAVIAHTGSGVTVDPEIPLFRWYSFAFTDALSISSAVVWDGAMYAVGWTYRTPLAGQAWIGAARVTRSGLPFDYRVTPAGVFTPPLSMAVNDAGMTGFAISENGRARLYLGSELAPMPPAPSAPRNVAGSIGANPGYPSVRLEWESDTPIGFIIDGPYRAGVSSSYSTTIPGDVRTFQFGFVSLGSLIRIRAAGPGGLSDGAIITVTSTPRRRAQRP